MRAVRKDRGEARVSLSQRVTGGLLVAAAFACLVVIICTPANYAAGTFYVSTACLCLLLRQYIREPHA